MPGHSPIHSFTHSPIGSGAKVGHEADVDAAYGGGAVTFGLVFALCCPMKYYKLTAMLLVLASAAHAAPPAPGQLIYQKNCARCHGKDGRLGLNGAHDLTKSNLNAFGRTYLVTSGMGKMPAFGKVLTPAQVQQVVAYSLTLK
jgi:cytochrome c6